MSSKRLGHGKMKSVGNGILESVKVMTKTNSHKIKGRNS